MEYDNGIQEDRPVHQSNEENTMRLQIVGSNMTVLSLADGTQVLFSYETPVAAQLASGDYVMTTQYYSNTTSKHIKKWLDGVKAAPCPQDYFDKMIQDDKP